MRRYSFYIFIAILTFVTGSLIALKIYQNSQASSYKIPKSLISDSFSKQSDIKSELQNPAALLPAQEILEDKSGKPFCRDKRILPVWNQLVNDKTFKEWEADARDSLDCALMLDVKELDLNRNGRKEILLRGNNSNLCSPVGNCGFWIYEKKGRKYRKLLASTDFWEITAMGEQVKKSTTNGYFDILLKGHFTASDTTYDVYEFNGTKYKQSKCSVETPIPGSSDNPKWKFLDCKEFFKRR
jgi:hypothetical protein